MADKHRFRITFLGAAQTVTGSMHLLEVGDHSILVDCGMFQGHRSESFHKNKNVPRKAVDADVVLLTHAHIDHSGNLPSLVKRGFSGTVHATSATADLCQAMLRDSARIQESDAAWLNRQNEGNPQWDPVEPLYTEKDAEEALSRFQSHPYNVPFELFPGVNVRYIDAGHVLGSSSIEVDVKLNGHRRRVLFSGDIGRRGLPILRDPTLSKGADYVVMESTYGNRLHSPVQEMPRQLLTAIQDTVKRGGKIIIPSFALERAQEIMFALNQLWREGLLKPIPVYLDSPLAVDLTKVFRKHTECYDDETLCFDDEHGDPFGFQMLTFTQSTDESKRLNEMKGPIIIISASGMCEAGRVVHHLRNSIEDARNTILIVGYQAQHTLGRRLTERRDRVKIFGVERDVRAEVRVLDSFSAHADRDELLWWAQGCGTQVRNFFLVHGDPEQQDALSERMTKLGMKNAVPKAGETINLDY